MNLNSIFTKALTTEQLTSDEIQFAASFESSVNVEEAIMANSILLKAGVLDERTIAYGRLRRICEEGSFYASDKAVAILLIILELFSKEQFQASPCFAKFVYRAAKHPFLGARVNAMRVLRQLAAVGDQKAIELLKDSLDDPHEYVSKTAQASLKLAGVET